MTDSRHMTDKMKSFIVHLSSGRKDTIMAEYFICPKQVNPDLPNNVEFYAHGRLVGVFAEFQWDGVSENVSIMTIKKSDD